MPIRRSPLLLCKINNNRGEEGYIAIDALVALTILTTTIGLTLLAGHTALRLNKTASEIQFAQTQLITLVEGASSSPSEQSGASKAFRWTVSVAPIQAAKSNGLCRIQATFISNESRRTYHLSAVHPCIAGVAS